MTTTKQNQLKQDIILPSWSLNSHKGMCGKVLIIGGAPQYYGAPILAALGAEAIGADLIILAIPSMHLEAAKAYSLNFFLHAFEEDQFTSKDLDLVTSLSCACDAMVIGNGLGKAPKTQIAILEFLHSQLLNGTTGGYKPIIIDAEALLPEVLEIAHSINTPKDWILTPHIGEFKRIYTASKETSSLKEAVYACACKYGITICLKGRIDYVVDYNGNVSPNHSGVPQMRVGGTGDVLAGTICALRSMGLNSFEAARTGTFLLGKIGELLVQEGSTITAHKLTQKLSISINTLIHNTRLKSEDLL